MTPTELTDKVSVKLTIVVVTVLVPFVIVNVEMEYGFSVASPEPDGPRFTLACVGKIISEEIAWVLSSPKAEPLVALPTSSLRRPARYIASREKCPPATGRALKSIESGTAGCDPSPVNSYRSVNGELLDVEFNQ